MDCMAGRHSKGARHAMMTRPAQPVADEIMRRAEAQGVTITDYIADVLSQHVGRPDLSPRAHEHDSQRLPMTG